MRSPTDRPRSRQLLLEVLTHQRNQVGRVVVAAGIAGGAIGAAYLATLTLLQGVLLPEHRSTGAQVLLMGGIGVAVALLVRLLGRPGDVELLVDNIHVSGGAEDVRSLRSLLPISLLCVGAGSPLGPEAPLVTTTGTVASWLGGRFRLGRDDRRVVSITGMAAGFTVLFAAPLGSALFALEILHRRGLEYYEALIPAAIGSLCGYAVSTVTTGLGLAPLWHLPAPASLHVVDLGYAVGAGIVGAALAAAFTYLSVGMRWLARRVPQDLQPVLGGVAIGSLAFVTPFALTNGEVQIHELTTTQVAAGTLALAAATKLVAAAVAMATGWRGGFIIPLFFAGYCLGRATDGHLPGGNSWVVAAALMVAVNVGVTKTPIGSTLVVTEMAGMTLLPTTLIASLVSLVLTSQVGLIESQQRRLDDDGGAPSGDALAGEPARARLAR